MSREAIVRHPSLSLLTAPVPPIRDALSCLGHAYRNIARCGASLATRVFAVGFG
jgi:hypothetical protein